MGLLDRLKSMAGVGVTYNSITTSPTDSGDDSSTTTNVAKALATAHLNPIVCAVVNWIVLQAAPTPFRMLNTVDDEVEVFTQHPMLAVLRKPSEDMSGRELFSVSIRDMLTSLHGQCFWRIELARDGSVVGLTYLQSRFVRVLGSQTDLGYGLRVLAGGPSHPHSLHP